MGNENSQHIQYGERLETDAEVKWDKVCSDDIFPGRDGHCACGVGKKLYVFGGVVHPRNPKETKDISESNDLLVFNLSSKLWSRIDATGNLPLPRSSATMAAIGTKLYLIGGLSREVGWFDTVYCFDTESASWSILETEGQSPKPRDKLASAVINGKIYIFGGFGPQGVGDELLEEEDLDEEEDDDDQGAQFGWFNDLFVLDPETRKWSNPMQMNLGCPTPRAAHAVCSVGKFLVIFGGRDAEGRKNDLHIFDTETRKWQCDLVIQGRQPQPRSFHTMNTVGDRVVIMGGRGTADQDLKDFHIFDTVKRQWIQPKLEGEVPEGRGTHTTSVVGDKFLVYGGSGNFSQETLQCTTYYSDVHTVPTDEILKVEALAGNDTVLENQENLSSVANVTAAKTQGLASAEESNS